MPQDDRLSLWSAASAAGDLSAPYLAGQDAIVAWSDLAKGSILGGRCGEFSGRSVLVETGSQLTAALALMELDGVARRLVLYPPDLAAEHAALVIASAEVDAIISDHAAPELESDAVRSRITCSRKIEPASSDRTPRHRTEWILLTSGTTGSPRMVVHSLSSLAGGIERAMPASPMVWSTFYDIRRYGGLQIFLRAVLGGTSLVLPGARESTADFLLRAGRHKLTHISGTPSHWRRALMSPAARSIEPQYIRLSGEIADQPILDHLLAFYPHTRVAHAFASTEAGVAFEVGDGRAGFPASLIGQSGDVEVKVEDGSLRIRSRRTAARYLGDEERRLAGEDGFIDTGDMVELRGDRYHFVGRRDGVINVGGIKVHPEEVEAVINCHPRVRMSLVRARKNPVTGALVVADVVLRAEQDGAGPERHPEAEILQFCRDVLPRHKVPAGIRVVPELTLSATGKMVRCHA